MYWVAIGVQVSRAVIGEDTTTLLRLFDVL